MTAPTLDLDVLRSEDGHMPDCDVPTNGGGCECADDWQERAFEQRTRADRAEASDAATVELLAKTHVDCLKWRVRAETAEKHARDAPLLLARVRELEAAAEEREQDMHNRIRLGYDKTVADSWKAKVVSIESQLATVTAERDGYRAALEESGIRKEISDARR